MRISLIDVDSKIPNLALMKISNYHKLRGDIVGFNLINPDLVYHSIIFTKNKNKAYNKTLIDVNHVFGGSGYDLSVKLPESIEYIKPDYDLYPSEYMMGYTTRGCNRNCYFCFVPKKEGCFKTHQHPEDFYDNRFDTVKLLDNNILLDKNWFKIVANWYIDHNVSVDMTQGYDIRLLDDKYLDLILKIKDKKTPLKFAFDDTKLESLIRKKIQMIKDKGVNTKNDVAVYCYCHNDLMHDDALYRAELLKSLNVNADVMWNCELPRTQRIKNLVYWSWRKQLFWSIPYEQYSKLLHT